MLTSFLFYQMEVLKNAKAPNFSWSNKKSLKNFLILKVAHGEQIAPVSFPPDASLEPDVPKYNILIFKFHF